MQATRGRDAQSQARTRRRRVAGVAASSPSGVGVSHDPCVGAVIRGPRPHWMLSHPHGSARSHLPRRLTRLLSARDAKSYGADPLLHAEWHSGRSRGEQVARRSLRCLLPSFGTFRAAGRAGRLCRRPCRPAPTTLVNDHTSVRWETVAPGAHAVVVFRLERNPRGRTTLTDFTVSGSKFAFCTFSVYPLRLARSAVVRSGFNVSGAIAP